MDSERSPKLLEPPRNSGEAEAPPDAPKPPLRRRLARLPREHPVGLAIGIVVIAVLVIGGFFLWRYLESYESTDDAEVSGHIDPVSPRVNGTVIGVYTADNRSVVAGQVLLELDPSDYQAALEGAEAGLSQARAALAAENPNVPITETANATSVATAQNEVAGAEAAADAARREYDSALDQLRQAEAENTRAQADEKRYGQLAAKDEVSRELYDQRRAAAQADAALVAARQAAAEAARRAINERQAALAEARSRLAEAQANSPRQLSVRRAGVASREADVQAAEARVHEARLRLGYCKIVAPVSGIVGDKNIELGQSVQAGEQLLDITQINDLWVTANFKETQIRRMRPGQRATIHVDALDRDFQGYVQNMPGATGAQYSLLPPENATGNYVKVVQRLPVRIRFQPGQAGLERLRPGMSVEPKVWLQ